MIVIPESNSSLDTKVLFEVLEKAEVTVEVLTVNESKVEHYSVCQSGKVVYECLKHTYRLSSKSSLQLVQIGNFNLKKNIKNNPSKQSGALEPEKRQELCDLVKKIEEKAYASKINGTKQY